MTSISPHALFGFGVHPRRWLIQQDDLWVADHTQGETQLKQVGVKVMSRHVSYRQKVPGRQCSMSGFHLSLQTCGQCLGLFVQMIL